MRAKATPEREAKLPQWAKDELDRLRREVAALRGDRLSETPTPVYLEDRLVNVKTYLTPAWPVTFELTPRTHIDVRAVEAVLARRRATRLHVASPDGRLVVYPSVSNVVTIEVFDL